MKLESCSFSDGGWIPQVYAFGKPDPKTHITLSDNKNPHFAWKDVPPNTRSFVLICHDSEVPSRPDGVNQEGAVIPSDLPRVDFTHWVLVDIPPNRSEIAEGEFSNGVTPGGKKGPQAKDGMRHGLNDYTAWFAGDPKMKGDYFGYDGPCPPWNDERIHVYHFTLYALDFDRLPVEGRFTRADVLKAMEGHVLAQDSLAGRYTLNPKLMPS